MAIGYNLEISQEEFKQLSSFIKKNYGITLGNEKQTLVVGRLQNVLQKMDFDNFSDYFNYIVNDRSGEAVITLINKITTNHTYFMRENSHFNFFRDNILPFLMKDIKNKDMRIWSAGCSSGEEPFTLAMILADKLGSERTLWNSKILATDISTGALDKAKKAKFTEDQIEVLPDIWRRNYFKKAVGLEIELEDKIKNEVVFRRFNLMESIFPFKKKFHIIFCRNVMIYFDEKTKYELINKFYDNLEVGGYFFIGQSETLNKELTKFKHIMPAVYRKD